jgi:hypothetical protein
MALFRMLHGDPSNINVDVTPFHEGWCYITHDGSFYADLNIGTKESPNNTRIQINDAMIKRLEALEKIINNSPLVDDFDGFGTLDAGTVLDATPSDITIIDPGVIIKV